MKAEATPYIIEREERAQHAARALALTKQLAAVQSEIERLQAEVDSNAGVKGELAGLHTTIASLVQERAVAQTEIGRLKAEAAANLAKDELTHTPTASLVQELAAARGEIERLRHEVGTHGKAKVPTHGGDLALTRELAATRVEIARVKNEAEAALERARAWRARFVAELQRKGAYAGSRPVVSQEIGDQ
jgi:chromosome segregation ATPase